MNEIINLISLTTIALYKFVQYTLYFLIDLENLLNTG